MKISNRIIDFLV
jgi:hypothetical protein